MRNNRSLRIRMSTGDRLTRLLCKLICLVFLVFFVVPVVYVLLSSMRTSAGWSMDGYLLLLRNQQVLLGLKNSIVLASVGTIYSLVLEIPAAYALSQKQYHRLTNLFFALGQFNIALLPLYLMLKQLGLLNSMWGLILPCGLSVYYTQLLRARMINFSAELEEAAELDGCGTLRYLLQIELPCIAPTVAVLAFFHVCAYWSNTLLAKTFLTDEGKFPLTLIMNNVLIQNQAADVFGSSDGISVAALQMAKFGLCVISALPPVGLFLLMRRHIKAPENEGGLVL